jgi:hypothetical protein
METAELLLSPESDWLDWKANYPGPLLAGSSSPAWDRGRAELLKDLVAIANGEGPAIGYLVYGVLDHGTHREVTGVTKHFDDADFQTWARVVFEPIPSFAFQELQYERKTLGVFEIRRIPEYPHVAIQSLGDTLCLGQVWLRQGTRNITAGRTELSRMVIGNKPFSFSRIDDPVLTEAIRQIETATGKKATMRRFGDLDSLFQQGLFQAYFPGSRRPIYIGTDSRGDPDLILLLR